MNCEQSELISLISAAFAHEVEPIKKNTDGDKKDLINMLKVDRRKFQFGLYGKFRISKKNSYFSNISNHFEAKLCVPFAFLCGNTLNLRNNIRAHFVCYICREICNTIYAWQLQAFVSRWKPLNKSIKNLE